MSSKYDGATLEVINWDTYNPRGDSKKPSWFRMDNDMLLGPGFFGLTSDHIVVWLFILSLVSKKNGQPIVWNSAYLESLRGIPPETQDQAIETFEKFVRLRVSRTDFESNIATYVRDSHATNERTNVTNEQDEPARRARADAPSGVVQSSEIQECADAWLAALKKHGSERGLLPDEDRQIGAAIQRWGHGNVKMAFLGAKYEPANGDFKPSQHLGLRRVLDPIKFERFLNLGAQAQKKLREVEIEKSKFELPLADPSDPPPDAQKVRALINQALKRGGAA